MSPRQQYQAAADAGLPTPLNKQPTYPDFLQPIVQRFWDILLYKPQYDSALPLLVLESYMRLFDIVLHPVEIRIICALDRVHTTTVNKIMQERNIKE